jgi:hypothetical protein
MILINYLLIGISIVFVMEVWFSTNKDQESKIEEEEDFKFDWFARVLNILIWPVTMAIFLKRFIEYLKKRF